MFVVATLMVGLLAALPAPAAAAFVPEWSSETDLGLERSQAVVVSDADGMIYVIGGFTEVSSTPVADASRYDPFTGEWVDLAPLPSAVRGACGEVGSDGRIYVFGGTGGLALTQIYDPATDSWSAGTPIPENLWEAKSAVYGDNIYILGGEGSLGDDSDVYKYNSDSDSWSDGYDLPAPRVSGDALRVDSYIYYIGGCSVGYTDPQDTTYRFYVYGTVWEEVAPLPAPMASHAATVGADGLVYVLGGSDTAYNIVGSFDVNGYCYNDEQDTWTALPDRAVGKKYLGAAATEDGRIFAVGGNNNTVVYAAVESITTVVRTVEVASSSVPAGGEIILTFESDAAYATETASYAGWYLISSDGWVYVLYEMYIPVDAVGVATIDLPDSIAPGDYVLHFFMDTDYETDYISWPELLIDIVVLDAYTLEEQLAMLEANMTALTDALESQIVDQAVEIAALQDEVAALQADIDALTTQLSTVEGDVGTLAEDLAALQTQLTALQTALDEANQDVGDVQTSVDDKMSAVMGYAIIGLLVVVVLLLIVMMVMGRKSAPPPAP